MDKELLDFLEYVESKVGCPYLWGGQGETLYDIVAKYAKGKSQSEANTVKMLGFMEDHGIKDTQFFDCSGLAVKWLLEHDKIDYDMTAAGLYRKCTPITEKEVDTGCWCFLKNSNGIYHIGYLVDKNTVVHAFNQEKGVIKEKRTARKWIYARPDFAFSFKTTQNAPKEPLKIGDKVTLTKSVKGYNTADNALKGKNPTVTYGGGEYYVYKFYKNAVNISKKKGSAGAWVVL
jgi:hypothetical protein